MRTFLIAACAIASAAAATHAQTRTAEAVPPAQTPVSVSSCVPAANVNAGRFRVPPPRSRALFRPVRTAAMHARNGMRVSFGLVPSTNLAAQAGSIDPTIPAMAFVSGDQYRGGPAPARTPALDVSPGTPLLRIDCPPQ